MGLEVMGLEVVVVVVTIMVQVLVIRPFVVVELHIQVDPCTRHVVQEGIKCSMLPEDLLEDLHL